MANALTGAYEAVVQVSVRQINGLLATLHQNGASEDAPLKLLHSATVRVGDHRPRPVDGLVGAFGDWVRTYQRVRGSVGLGDLRAHLTGMAPPGAARMIEDFFSKFGQAEAPETPPGTVRGLVKVQLASPTLSLPSGSTSEVTVHVAIRAHYDPDAGTDSMPEPVHGEVQATFEVRQVGSKSSRRLLIRPSSQDSKIQFIAAPGTGLSAADVGKISAQVRKAVRESFTLLPVDLPPDFPFHDFKGLGSGPGQVLALPIQLSGVGLPPGGIQSVNHLFIGSSGFAFAVSKDYVDSLFDIAAIRESITSRHIRRFRATYNLRFSSGPTLTWHSHAIEISGRVEAETGAWWAPNGFVSFRQRIALELNVATQSVLITRLGNPAVDESWFISHDDMVNLVRGEVDNALLANTPPVNNTLNDAKGKLNKGLHSFDRLTSAGFTALEITPDGIVVRGVFGTFLARSQPIVEIAETDQHHAFTALESWIPGGGIARLIWSWVEFGDPSIFSGVTKTFTDEHRFILPKPAGITELSSICLRIEGSQTLPGGQVVSAAGGTTCHVPDFGQVLEAPSWWEPVTLPIWLPDSTAGTILKDVVAGHVSVQAETPQRNGPTRNSLVYFADWRADRPLVALGEALAQMRRESVSLVVIVVLPAGAFDSHRREVEAKLDSIAGRFRARLLLTEDHEGGWTRTFAVPKTPSTYLINARREFVWKHEGAVDPKVLAAALDEHLVPAPAPRSRPLRLAVSPGDRAPDAFFEDDRGRGFALHRLRGRDVLFNFWQSWSAPCIKELLRLELIHKHAGGRAPLIVGFHGGNERNILDKIRKQHGLSFPLVQDADQVIARRYGVRCWPTTVSIDADGLVSHVQFGLSHEHAPLPERKEAGS